MTVNPPISPLVRITSRRRSEGQFPPGPLRNGNMLPLLHALHNKAATQNGRIIEVISSQSREGVSTVVNGLARAATESAGLRVLICDVLQAPAMLGYFGLTTNPVTLCEAASKGLDLCEAIVWLRGSEIAVCALANEAWSSRIAVDINICRNIMSSLRTSFDLILLEAPAVSKSPVGQSVARATDGVIVVVESERTRMHSVTATRKAIEMAGGTVAGIVLNKRRRYIPDAIYRFL